MTAKAPDPRPEKPDQGLRLMGSVEQPWGIHQEPGEKEDPRLEQLNLWR